MINNRYSAIVRHVVVPVATGSVLYRVMTADLTELANDAVELIFNVLVLLVKLCFLLVDSAVHTPFHLELFLVGEAVQTTDYLLGLVLVIRSELVNKIIVLNRSLNLSFLLLWFLVLFNCLYTVKIGEILVNFRI